jgi:autotransporter-associated beta strand protein
MKKTNCTIRFSSFSPILPSLIRIVAVCAGLLSVPMHAAILTWSGFGGPNANWNNLTNWDFPYITPGNGDTLIFPAGAFTLLCTNNIANLTLKQIRFVGAGGGYDIRGNVFTLTNSIVATNTAGANTIENNITLATSAVLIVVSNGVSLTLDGTLSGSVGVNKAGLGTLTLSGSSANTYGGLTTVNEGELDLNKTTGSAIPAYGPGLVIGDGIGTDTVRCLNNYQIWSIVTPTTINSSGVLDLNGHVDEAAPLSLNGGSITTGSAGQFRLYGTVTILSAATATISGNVLLDSGVVINNYSGANLDIPASISGSYGITLAGAAGSVYFQSSNSYTGLTVVQQGYLWAENSWALGSTNSGTVVSNGASLVLPGNVGITNESLTLNGPGVNPYWGALDVENTYGTTGVWTGPITVNADSTIMPYESGVVLSLLGPISGPGGVIVGNNLGSIGTLTFEGSTANTYAGLTTVSSGTLVLNKSISNQTIPGNLVINGTLRLGAAEQIANSADMLINPSGVFDTGVNWETIDTLHGSGGVTFGVNGWIEVGGNNGSSTYDGVMSGTGYTFGGYTVAKLGSGTFTMNGNNTFTAGATHVFNGKLVINGSQPQSPVIVDPGATLGGSGTVGTITANGNGIISPGNSPGILTSSNVTFTATGNFTVELTGPNPGVGGYDQLNVRGTVSLATATLTVIPAFTTPVSIGQQFIIINNDLSDAITGTFNGMANGSLFSAGGYKFRINYAGGAGNDVVLTLWGVPGNTVTLNAVGQGWYNSAGTGETRNYSAGEDSGISNTNIYRNWFVFNVPVSSNSIIHAELLINDYYNSSPNGQETYLLRKVTTPIATLEAVGSGHVGIYNDLGTGAVYSVRSIATNEALQTAIIPLNVQFFNDATAASGGQIALGGSIATLDAVNNHNQYLFGYSLGAPGDVQLRLTFGTNVVINSANLGWYNNLGNHTANNQNYFVGDNGVNFYRNFFVFNLPVLSSQFVAAELLVNSYTNVSPAGFETYQLYDVTNSITVLTNNASGATNVYADLGSGAVYGGRNVYVSESGFIASIPLNGSFLGAALANSSGRIALGGALTSLNPAPTVKNLFSFSLGLPTDAQLWLGFLTAPASHPSFVGGTPTYLGNNQFQLTVSGTIGTTNEIQGSFDFQNWDFIRDLVMTNSTTSFHYTNNTVVPYRFFRAEQLQ